MFKTKRILIDGLQIYPSIVYASTLTGLIASGEKTQDIAELMSDGGIIGNSKINSKKINLAIAIKKENDIKAYLDLSRIFSKRKFLIQVEYDYIGVVETYVFAESWAVDEDGNMAIVGVIENPYVESNILKEIELGVIKEGGVFVGERTTNFPITFDTKISGNKGTITNNCISKCWSIIEIKGVCSNIDIFNETTNERMKVNIDLSSNDKLIIDSRPSTRGVYLNGQPRPDLKNGNWISIAEGENIFKFNRTASMSDTTKHCKVMFRERWI